MNFELLIDKSPICTAEVAFDHKILNVNPAWSISMGISFEKLISKKHSEITRPDDAVMDIAMINKLLSGKITEYPLKPIYENIHTITAQGVFINIAEREKGDIERLKYTNVLNQSPESIIITDSKANIEYVNRRFTEITGYEKDEVLTKNPNILQSHKVDNQLYVDMWTAISSGKVWKGELINKRKSGELYWERKTISPVVNEFGRLINYISFGEDITSQKKIEQELIAAKGKAEESDKLKTAFIQNISHEIRTPMNSLLGFVQLLQQPDFESKFRKELIFKNEFIDVINQCSERLLNTVNDIMEISKIESGVKNLLISKVNIHEIIQQNIISFKTLAFKKGLDLRLSERFLTGKSANIQTDRTKLGNILANLIENALKFTETGSIEIGNYLDENSVVFFVKDTGIGISETHKELIFDRFTQVDLRLTRRQEGTGLGLAIVKGYLEALKGRVWINSEVGKGSTFYFSIPYLYDN